MTDEELEKRKRRSIVIGASLLAFAVLFYAITIIRMGGDVLTGRCNELVRFFRVMLTIGELIDRS